MSVELNMYTLHKTNVNNKGDYIYYAVNVIFIAKVHYSPEQLLITFYYNAEVKKGQIITFAANYFFSFLIEK